MNTNTNRSDTPVLDALYGDFMQDAPKLSKPLLDRQKDLINLILEAQVCLLLHPHSESGKRYNRRLRKIISSIQDLRDGIYDEPKQPTAEETYGIFKVVLDALEV